MTAVSPIDFFQLVAALDVREPAKVKGDQIEWFSRDGRKRVCVARCAVKPLMLWTLGEAITCERDSLVIDPAVLRPCAEGQAPVIAQTLATQAHARACVGVDVIEGRSTRYFTVESFARVFERDPKQREQRVAWVVRDRLNALYRTIEPLARPARRPSPAPAALALSDNALVLRLAAEWFAEDLAIAAVLIEIASDFERSSEALSQSADAASRVLASISDFAAQIENFARRTQLSP
ncbi:MAG: hypothetical protein U0269_12090 [Polyangiales bacterium]